MTSVKFTSGPRRCISLGEQRVVLIGTIVILLLLDKVLFATILRCCRRRCGAGGVSPQAGSSITVLREESAEWDVSHRHAAGMKLLWNERAGTRVVRFRARNDSLCTR